MRKIKIWSVLLIIFIVTFLSGYSTAVDLFSDADAINIETNLFSDISMFTDIDKHYQIEGPIAITINNIEKGTSCILKFDSVDRESHQVFKEEVFLQYRVVSFSEKGEWSRWFSLKSLPMKFNLENQNGFPDHVILYICIKVPRSVEIRQGVYQGEFILEVG